MFRDIASTGYYTSLYVGGPHVQLAVVGTCLIVKNIGLYFCNLHYSNGGYVFTLKLYYLGFIIGKIKY